MHPADATPAFERLFLSCFSLTVPVVQLGRLPHWTTFVERVLGDAAFLSRRKALIVGGFFYNLWTPAPTPAVIDDGIGEMQRIGADLLVVPNVRSDHDTHTALDDRLIRIPAFIESSIELGTVGSVDDQLRKTLGGDRLRKMRKRAQRARELYSMEFIRGNDPQLTERTFKRIVAAHYHNVVKYHHPVNLYSEKVVRLALSPPLRDCINFAVRRDRAGSLVQAQIAYEYASSRELVLAVQGIDPAAHTQGQNLFSALHYEMYLHAFDKGIRRVYLGRGAELQKAELGATTFRIQDFLAYTDDPGVRDRLRTLATRSKEMITPPVPKRSGASS